MHWVAKQNEAITQIYLYIKINLIHQVAKAIF